MNLYDVLAGQGTTHFERLFSQRFAGSGKTQTLTGVPPLTFKADGKPLISWSMLGNGQQTGTPTPDNPIIPDFCGVRTGNLFDAATVYGGMYDSATGILVGAASDLTFIRNKFVSSMVGVPITISIRADDVPVTRVYIRCTIGGTNIDSNAIANGKTGTMMVTVTPTSVNDDWRITYGTGEGDITLSNIMLNSGSTALPYEPYGYKIPILSNSTTTPVYLGEVQTTRKVKKLVLTGEETFNYAPSGKINRFRMFLASNAAITDIVSTHYKYEFNNAYGNAFVNSTLNTMTFCDDYGSETDFKAFLAQQYAAGTPVTVWYALAEPETAIVNEPLAKIGDYADELSSTDAVVTIPTANGQNTLTVDTELQPSEMTITYKV